MAFIILNDRERDAEDMRYNMRKSMRTGYRGRMVEGRNHDDYEMGYRHGYKHGWEDYEDEGDESYRRRRRNSRGEFI